MAENPSCDEVYEIAAELFGLLAAPVRLRIVCALCKGERNVGELMECVGGSQPNVSQHLGMLYRARLLGRRREGAQVYYRVTSQRLLMVCESMCH